MPLPKKYIFFSLLGLLAVSALHAQMGSKKPGMQMGGFNSNKGMGGGMQSSFGKKGMSTMGGGMGSHSSGSSGSSSQASNKSTYTSNYSSSSQSSSSHYSHIGGSGSSGYSSSGSSGSSGKVTSATLKGVSSSRSYPGIGKSKIIKSLKGGTRYSYPGVHNIKNDIDKLKKKATGGSGNSGSSKK